MYIILSQDAKSSLRLQYAISGNASVVAVLSYTMAGWQHGSKHSEVWRQCPFSPWEQNQNKWPPFRVDVTVCDGDYEERPQFTNYCCSRTQTLFANMFNWKKTDFSNIISKLEYRRFVPFHTSNLPYHPYAIPYSIPIFSFHSIFHSIPQYAVGYITKTEM